MYADQGRRLKEERQRLGLTQDQLGVAIKTQRFYEIGERSPDAGYLLGLAERGGDVLYVITGQRAVGVVAADEAVMLEAYRAAPEAVRKAALAALLTGQTSPGAIFTVHGSVGAQVNGPATFGDINLGGKK